MLGQLTLIDLDAELARAAAAIGAVPTVARSTPSTSRPRCGSRTTRGLRHVRRPPGRRGHGGRASSAATPDGGADAVSILRLDAVRREIGDFVILDSVSGAIARGERVGLVGPNGAGKTTLLRIVAGRDEPDRGRVHIAGGVRLGMLGQESNRDEAFAGAPSVLRAVRSGAAEVERLELQLQALESAGAGAVADAGVRPTAGAVRPPRRLSPRPAGGGDALRPRRAEGGLGAATHWRCRVASRPGSRWRGCWSTTRTCCCSTSPPTTSTSPRWSGWRRTSPDARARCSSRPTTGRSWTRS